MLVGVTGGMGSGKSSLARLLAARGGILVDADAIAHRVLDRPEVLQALQEAFGRDVVDAGGRLNRPEVGRRAFASQAGWQRLNRIVRPPLAAELWREVEQAKKSAGEIMVVVDAPLIFEWEVQDRFDAVVVVDADEEVCVARAAGRSGLSKIQIRQRMAFQLSAEEKKERADFVVDNSGDLEQLEEEAARLWEELEKRRNKREKERKSTT